MSVCMWGGEVRGLDLFTKSPFSLPESPGSPREDESQLRVEAFAMLTAHAAASRSVVVILQEGQRRPPASS